MSQSNHTGPIVFSDETARRQLEKYGEVVTFRGADRTTGETWWRASRLGEKEGDVTVEKIGPANPEKPSENMKKFAGLSGFDSVSAWLDAIESLNGSLDRGYLYRVSKRSSE